MIVLSETGTTARLVAKFRPNCFVICLTPNETVARQCSGIYKGVHAYKVDSLENTDELLQIASSEAIKAGLAKAGDKMVLVCGKTYGAGANDQIKVELVTDFSAPSSVGLHTGHLRRGFSFSGLEHLK
jgi:pyruvate kinase